MRHPGLLYDSPLKFSLQQRLILRIAPRILWSLLRGLSMSCKLDVIDRRYFDEVQERHGTVVVGIWHETLPIALNIYRYKGYHTMVSQSFDGEIGARCCEAFGLHAVRGSSSRGGGDALRDLVAATQLCSGVGFTLDGPRGPRREPKAGIALLSARTGIPVVPNAIVAHPAWRLNSWDRMAFPKPFSRITCAYAPPIPPPADTSPEAIEDMRLRVESSLNELHARFEADGA